MAAVDELLTCAVCLEWFKSPRRLPCHHVYCLECLRDLVKPGIAFITCPECRCEHTLQNDSVEDFKEDGRLVQFMDKQVKLESNICSDCKQCLTLSECDHCQLPTCHECQSRHGVQLLQSLLHDLQQLHSDLNSEKLKTARQTLKTELLHHKENCEILKARIHHGIDAMVKELENCRANLLATLSEEETLISNKLSDIERAEIMTCQYVFSAGVVEANSLPKAIVCMKGELTKQKQLMTSLDNGYKRKGLLNIQFNEEKKMKSGIGRFGDFFTNIDYKKEFTLLGTLDGSESGGDVFNEPWGLTVCPFTDNVYMIDNNAIWVYSSNGKYLRSLVTNDLPSGLAVDNNGRIIVACYEESNVKIYNSNLELMKSFGLNGDENGEFASPFGVTCDVDNNIYVVDNGNKSVQVFTPDGSFLSEIGRGMFQDPYFIQINKRHEILVTDCEKGQVVIFSRDGQHLRNLPENSYQKTKPVGICIDGNGFILANNRINKSIQVYKDDGTQYCTITEPATAMNDIYGLAVTASGVLFIADHRGKLHMIATCTVN